MFSSLFKVSQRSYSDMMPKVDLSKESIQRAQLDYMKVLEKENLERVRKLKGMKSRNIWTACALAGSVFGIYAYSMFAVKQEDFLDEIEEKQ